MPRKESGALAPYRVLDLTGSRAALAGQMLAALGAEVILVEPPGGSPARFEPPLADGLPRGLASLRFHAGNRGKRSVEIDLDHRAGQARFLDLVTTADFVLDDAAPGRLEARGLGFESLRDAQPSLVHVSITPFGQDGPYAGHVATDLTLAAMGGMMALNGDADRRPVRISVPQCWYHASADAVVGALVANARRIATGEAQHVDVSVQTAVFWTALNAMSAHRVSGKDIERTGSIVHLGKVVIPLVYPAKDGELVLLPTANTARTLIAWMEADGIVGREWVEAEDWSTYEVRMLTGGELVHSPAELLEKISIYCSKHPKTELMKRGIEVGATIAPVNRVTDVLALEHLEDREYWESLPLPDGRTLRAPGAFVRASRTPVSCASPAPALAEANDEILGGSPPRARVSPPATTRGNGETLPFAGLKVADFSWIVAGPTTAKVLADHGATVIRIESATPMDRLRMAPPFHGEPGKNRSQFFGSFNTSKLSLTLDLKSTTGIEIARRMVGWADVMLDSFTAGTMADLGLGYEEVRRQNPGIIMATTCLMGQTGRAAPLAGYGSHAAAVCGFCEVTGWDDRAPAGPYMAYTDSVAPRFLAATILAALDHRRRTGEGQFLDQSQMESSLHFLAPEILDAQVSGRVPRRAGNDCASAVPHDAYPCAGEDQWCAIAVETDAQWQALRRALGDPEWTRDAALDTLGGRQANRERIDRALAAVTVREDAHALMERLQAAGVPAGKVQRSSDLERDPQLGHRGFFRPLRHTEVGEVVYEGHPFRVRGYDSGPRSAAPCLGEHTEHVLRDLLGYRDEEVARFVESGALR